MVPVEFVDGTIDLLTHGTCQLHIAGGGQALDALVLEARPQFGLAAALLPVPFVTRREFPLKRAIRFAVRGGDEVGNPNVNANDRRTSARVGGDGFLIREGE